jgi:hypothetical protein
VTADRGGDGLEIAFVRADDQVVPASLDYEGADDVGGRRYLPARRVVLTVMRLFKFLNSSCSAIAMARI